MARGSVKIGIFSKRAGARVNDNFYQKSLQQNDCRGKMNKIRCYYARIPLLLPPGAERGNENESRKGMRGVVKSGVAVIF